MWLKIFASSGVFLGATGLMAIAGPYLLTRDSNLNNSPVVTMMARSQVKVGDDLAVTGAFGAAAEAYEVAARLVRAQGKLPVEEVRRVANARYYAGEFLRAARTLENLADEASAQGDYLAHFWAAVDAGRLARLAGAENLARRCDQRVDRLLSSPDLPAETRAELAEKLAEVEFRVFAPHLTTW